jgi:type I restriction enzyme S subunit
VPSGSLIVSTRAPIGYVVQSVVQMAFNQGCRGLRPVSEHDARYMRYQLLSRRDQLVAAGQGSTVVELSSEGLASTVVAFPPVRTQRAIADYLDAETTRIDALITKKRRMIELLDERRWNVTDPLDVGYANDSAWRTTALKRLATVFTDGDWIESPFITSEGIRLIQTGNIGRGEFKDQGDRYISEETFTSLRCTEVFPGDVLISRLANTVGQACRAPDLGVRMVTSVDVVIMRPSAAVDADYLVLWLSSGRHLDRARMEARGSTMQRLARSQVGELPVVLPLLDRQRQIAAAAQRSRTPVSAAVDVLATQINLLHEHRQALITAAVTGEVDVPGVAA